MALTTKHQVLAWDLVEGLGDEKHKGVYFRLAKTYDESFLRRILSLVKDVWHRGKIKSEDRGKYFMGILKKELKIYGKNIKNYPRGRSGSKKKIGTRKKSKKSRNSETD
ncbi:MAG: hypothetical protein Q7K16_02940 [Candidatus Azambacteria bacterium]|nr:hypothetical protein [Candidatus Azambacteria bacterium]